MVAAARTPEGARLHAERFGAGPPMLLLNGLFCSTHHFAAWVPHFAPRYRVVQWDYRGHGASDDAPTPSTASIGQFTDDALRVLELAGPERAILVGHSMGVRVALEMCARAPERVAALILLCGSVWDSLGPIFSRYPLARALDGISRVADRLGPLAWKIKAAVVASGLIPAVGYLIGSLSRELTPPSALSALLDNVRRLDVRLATAIFRSYLAHSGRPLLAGIRAPTLVVCGEIDQLAPPAHGGRVLARLADGELHIARGCTHLAPIERPDEVHAVVDDFLRRRCAG